MALSPTTEVSSKVVDLTAFRLDELRSGRSDAVEAALSWAKAYAIGPEATAIQEQNQ